MQGQVEFVANGDQTLPSSNNLGAIDDLYVRVGKWNAFDITAGRFQGWSHSFTNGMWGGRVRLRYLF